MTRVYGTDVIMAELNSQHDLVCCAISTVTYIQIHCLVCCVVQMHCILMSLLQADITNIDITRLHILCLRLTLTSSKHFVSTARKTFMLHARCNAHEDAQIRGPCRLVEARTPLRSNSRFCCIDISIFYIPCQTSFRFLRCTDTLLVLPSGEMLNLQRRHSTFEISWPTGT
jgi:hypothetical protein